MATATITVPLGCEWSSGPVVSTLDTSTSLAAASTDVRAIFGGMVTRDQAAEGLEVLRLKVLQSVSWPPT
jgi:hypothetical protein